MPMRLDEALPTWHHRERHHVQVAAPAPAVMHATRELGWADVPIFRFLTTVRFGHRVRDDGTGGVLRHLTSGGFRVVEDDDHHLLVVAIASTRTRPAALTSFDPGTFREFDRPGHIKTAFEFRTDGRTLTTETRVWATDTRSRRLFAAYWVVIRPFSGLIRHEWLRAIRRRAVPSRR